MPQDNSFGNAQGGEKKMGFLEAAKQGLALLFAVQDKAGRRRLLDLAETNPLPVLFSGFMAAAFFFSFCFITSQLVIYIISD